MIEIITETTAVEILLLLQVFSTGFMTGLIWFVQIVHYPLLAKVGAEKFIEYETLHCRLTGWVVMPAMLVELISAFLFLVFVGNPFAWNERLLGGALVIAIWFSTFFFQARYHRILSSGFDQRVWQKLVRSNWLRTVLWTFRFVLIAYWIMTLLS